MLTDEKPGKQKKILQEDDWAALKELILRYIFAFIASTKNGLSTAFIYVPDKFYDADFRRIQRYAHPCVD
ncbi:hypothetical protein [Pantoea anthophila]|uniref:Uncharacterized protein n=1 Tax=Pantoea anthophila TaxID=470931 RepID=A0ABY2ZDN0_9GAMM|nr:hypothetical protein [Pantoea anthophila]TPV28747.1 hypothetical protein FJW00_07250 [Pantoea anthophila]WIM53873.1 hypothetical protein P7T05_15315 [Pantoea anthophila]